MTLLNVYPGAKFVPITLANTGGPMQRNKVRLFVIHIAQGANQSGVDSWFNDPAAKVSAHFSISRTGVVHQYVKLDWVSWAEQDYNDVAISIEHCGFSGQTLTARQLAASTKLLTWLHGQFPHVPLVRTANPNGTGVIGHGELGIPGGDHPDCPGNPVLGQFDRALRLYPARPSVTRLPFLG
jgi:N-acetyl-anhydromuramyl-L-alanine amidase AmpD